MASTLTDSAQARLLNIQYTTSGLGLLGGIAGVIYSNRTGGHFWRGVGYFFLGSIVVGVAARLVALPFENKIIKEGTVGTISDTKDTANVRPLGIMEYGYA